MGKNGINPSAFGAIKIYLQEHVGQTVSIKNIFGCGALGRTSYNSYLSMLIRAGFCERLDGAYLSDPNVMIRIIKALPFDWGSADLKSAAKDAVRTTKLEELL
jgi:hypothetical protein